MERRNEPDTTLGSDPPTCGSPLACDPEKCSLADASMTCAAAATAARVAVFSRVTNVSMALRNSDTPANSKSPMCSLRWLEGCLHVRQFQVPFDDVQRG